MVPDFYIESLCNIEDQQGRPNSPRVIKKDWQLHNRSSLSPLPNSGKSLVGH
jgi:hypothetical protein